MLHEHDLRDLERQRRWGDPGSIDCVLDLADEARVLELARRKVDAHPELGLAEAVLPDPRLATGLLDDPAADGHDLSRLFGEGDELRGHDHRSAGRLPAEQRLDAHDRARGELDDGLVREPELVLAHCPMDESLELGALRHPGPHRGFEHLRAPLAGPLRSIHGEVGVAQQIVGRLRRGRRQCDADTRADDRVDPAEADRRADRFDQAVGDGARVVGRREIFEEDGELIASQASRGVARPEDAGQPACHFTEQLVAGGMAESVVHRLEVIEVEEENRERRLAARAPGEGMLDAVREEGPVREPTQTVVERLVPDLLVEAGVVQGDRRLVGERPGKAEVMRRDPPRIRPVDLDRADRLATGNEREHRHAPHPDRAEVLDLGGIGRWITVGDEELGLVMKDALGRGIVGEVV